MLLGSAHAPIWQKIWTLCNSNYVSNERICKMLKHLLAFVCWLSHSAINILLRDSGFSDGVQLIGNLSSRILSWKFLFKYDGCDCWRFKKHTLSLSLNLPFFSQWWTTNWFNENFSNYLLLILFARHKYMFGIISELIRFLTEIAPPSVTIQAAHK